jgi:hypothetical protein
MYVHGMEHQLIERAHFGDLSGMHFARAVGPFFEAFGAHHDNAQRHIGRLGRP